MVYRGQFVILDSARTASADTRDTDSMRDLHDNLCMTHAVRGGKRISLLKRFCREPNSPDGFVLSSVNAGRGSPYVSKDEIETITPVVGVVFEDPRLPRTKGRAAPTITTPPPNLVEE